MISTDEFNWTTGLLPNERIFLGVNWEVVSQDKTFNTSKVHICVYVVCRVSRYSIDTYDVYKTKVTTDDKSLRFYEPCTWICSAGEKELIVDAEFECEHNSDGNKNIRLSILTKTPIQYAAVGQSPTEDDDMTIEINEALWIQLPNIPQSSTIIPFEKDIIIDGQNAFTVNINPLENTYRHDVTYTLGEYSHKIVNIYDSASFIIPIEWLSAFPTTYSKKGIISVDTYDDDGAKVGETVSTYWIANVPENAEPTFDGSIANITASNTISAELQSFGYIQGVSAANINIIGFKSLYGADIVSVKLSMDDYDEISNNITVDENGFNNCCFITPKFLNPGTNKINAYAIDSRGEMSEYVSIDIEVVPYNSPKFVNVITERCEADGSLLNEGTHLRSNISYIYDDFNGKNTIKQAIYYKQSTENEFTKLDTSFLNGITAISTSIFNISIAYEIKYTITDLFSSSEYIDVLPISEITMEFLNGGKGIAFGKEAEIENAADFGYKLYARRGIMPYQCLATGNLSNGKYGYNLNDYTLFAVVVDGCSEPVIAYKPLTTSAAKGRSADTYLCENPVGSSPAIAISSCNVTVNIDSDGDKFTAIATRAKIVLFWSSDNYMTFSKNFVEATVTEVYALI